MIQFLAIFFLSVQFLIGESYASEVVLDSIEIEGVSQLSQAEIEGVLEIGPGDVVSSSRVRRTVENIHTVYETKGYYGVSVRSDLIRRSRKGSKSQTVLRILVSEGQPTLILSIDYVSRGLRDEKSEENWQRIKQEINREVNLKSGSVFDQASIDQAKRRIEAMLAEQEYVGARVSNVQSKKEKPPEELDKDSELTKVGWVSLIFEIEIGDKVTFGFRGNERLTRNQLMELVQNQRELGFSRKYIEDTRSRIEQEYLSLGYAKVEVVPYTFERAYRREKHVSYAIEEGPRVRIDNITFDGNFDFSDSELESEFYSLAPELVSRGYYVESEVEKTAKALIDWVKSKGYLSAKMISINKAWASSPGRVNLTVYFYEGNQTLLDKVTFVNLKTFSKEFVQGELSLREGEPLNLFALIEGIERLKGHYYDEGYLDFRVKNEDTNSVVKYSDKNRRAEVVLIFDEGVQYKVSDIIIEGLLDTKQFIVTRELEFTIGDILRKRDIVESEKRLRKLGLFSVVSIEEKPVPGKSDEKSIRVYVEENVPGILSVGLGFRNDLGIRVFGETGYKNIFGKNHTGSLAVNVNRRLADFDPKFGLELETKAAYILPWVMGIPRMTFRPEIAYERRQFLNYKLINTSISATIEVPIVSKWGLSASLGYLFERPEQREATVQEDNGTFRIGTLIPGFKLDLRDDPLAPRWGVLVKGSYEYAAPELLSQNNPTIRYERVLGQADLHWIMFRDVRFYASFRTGFERNLATNEIPAVKTFSLGGVGSLRGYKPQELNLSNQAVLDTASFVNYRFQFDVPISGAFHFGPFFDAANLLVDNYSFSDDLQLATGLGFRYFTPVGPVNLEWGYKLTPPAGSENDRNQIHFSVGIL